VRSVPGVRSSCLLLVEVLSVEGLPSTEDLDLAEALGAALAGLPAGQRYAEGLYYLLR
jgi:hypothetical protein